MEHLEDNQCFTNACFNFNQGGDQIPSVTVGHDDKRGSMCLALLLFHH